MSSFRRKLKALYTVWEVLWNLIQGKLDPQANHNWNFRRPHTYYAQPVAYLGVPAPGDEVNLGAPNPVRSWQHRCQEWVGSNGASKVDSVPASGCYTPASKFNITVTSQNWRQDLRVLEIINHRSVKNLIVSREASSALKFRSRLNYQNLVLRHSKLRFYTFEL